MLFWESMLMKAASFTSCSKSSVFHWACSEGGIDPSFHRSEHEFEQRSSAVFPGIVKRHRVSFLPDHRSRIPRLTWRSACAPRPHKVGSNQLSLSTSFHPISGTP